MDDLLLQSLALVAFIFFYYVWRSSRSKPMNPQVPALPGAWPFIGHLPLLNPQIPLARSFAKLADKYGPFFRIHIGHNTTLVANNLEVIKECFTQDKVFATRPPTAAAKYLGYNYAFVTMAPQGPYWRDIKKMMTLELLSKTRLDLLKHIRTGEVDTCIKELYSYWAKNGGAGPVMVDMSRWFCRLNFNINTMITVGKRYFNAFDESKDDIEAVSFEKAIEEHTRLTGMLVLSDMLPFLEWLDFQGHLKTMKCLGKELDSILGNWLEDHKKKEKVPGDEQDFMDVMLSIFPEDKLIHGYDRDTVVKATVLNLIVGGTDTIFISVTWALALVINHPEVLKRVQDEMDEHIGRDRQVEESDVKNLVYLQAIFKEALRLYPPGPVLPHEAMEDCQVGGYHVPKGTRLLLNIWKLHRDPTVWSDPDEFRPDRFLTTQADLDYRGQQLEYIPFSAGRRICPGITFATQVVHLTIARLLQAFDVLSPLNGPVDMSEGVGITLPKAKPLQVLVTPRLPSKLYED